ncbi:MAG TPA: response regulator [Phototrophicaceae bacterium]|nr:response regulator [Phototrophicaceae bacterium]
MKLGTVLIMEDDLNLLSLLSRLLQSRGYAVNTATTLQEARAHLARQHFDLFVCDMRMGDECGVDLLKEYTWVLRCTHVVAMSAEEQYRRLCEDLGVEIFLSKPLIPTKFVQLAEKLVPTSY